MRNYLLLAVAAAALTTPALARDGQPYVGIEGGILFPKDQDGDARVDYTTTQAPATPVGPAGPADARFNNAVGLDYRKGSDIDLIAGYDFGAFRLEAELGRKRARLDEFEINDGYIAALNTALNRPSVAPDPGAPGLAALTDSDFDLDGKVKVRSIMANALLDFGNEDGLSFYAGGGAGRARVKLLGDTDSKWAFQAIAGMRYALSPNIDFGLKYRYFRTGKVNLNDGTTAFAGNPDQVNVGTTAAPILINQTTNAVVSTDFEQKFRSHSLLASLIFNFGAPAPAAAPVYVAPPAPPAPATQTCPDGSVILTTDYCPAPVAPPVYVPPPAPMPAPERG